MCVYVCECIFITFLLWPIYIPTLILLHPQLNKMHSSTQSYLSKHKDDILLLLTGKGIHHNY